jgi:hypothetical protein
MDPDECAVSVWYRIAGPLYREQKEQEIRMAFNPWSR